MKEYFEEHFTVKFIDFCFNKEFEEKASLDFIRQLIFDERAGEIEIKGIFYKQEKKNLVNGFRLITV